MHKARIGPGMLDSLVGRIGLIAGGIGLLLGVATISDPLAARWGWWLWPARAVAAVSILGGLAAVAAFVAALGWRRIDRRRGRGAPDVRIGPTGGPSPEIRLVVTNNGRSDKFQATASIVATRHDVNPRRVGTYALPWQGGNGNLIPLDRLQIGSLVVGRFQLLDPVGIFDRMGEAQVIEWNGRREATWSGFRWIMTSEERLPEYDIEVRIVGEHSARPFIRMYTLTPETFAGPLQLVELHQ